MTELSKLEQFAMHAPCVTVLEEDGEVGIYPPDWFEIEGGPELPDASKRDDKFRQLMSEFHVKRRKHEECRFFAWRWYYAKQMDRMAELNRRVQ